MQAQLAVQKWCLLPELRWWDLWTLRSTGCSCPSYLGRQVGCRAAAKPGDFRGQEMPPAAMTLRGIVVRSGTTNKGKHSCIWCACGQGCVHAAVHPPCPDTAPAKPAPQGISQTYDWWLRRIPFVGEGWLLSKGSEKGQGTASWQPRRTKRQDIQSCSGRDIAAAAHNPGQCRYHLSRVAGLQ